MFTGIIEAIGKVVEYDGNRLTVQTPFRKIARGESISVDGVCLTVSAIRSSQASFDVGPETARVTTLGSLRAGSPVNLERALRLGDRLGGHWVTGHVDATGRLQKIERAGRNRWFYVTVPSSMVRYIVPKGSIAINGISLTVVSRRGRAVKIMIIPHTLSHTNLGVKQPGDRVNLETDVLAKYVLRNHS